MHLFLIMIFDQKVDLCFKSLLSGGLYFRVDRYFRDVLTSTEFYRYFRDVATFRGSLLWELYSIARKG